jgi:hypothetical protein
MKGYPPWFAMVSALRTVPYTLSAETSAIAKFCAVDATSAGSMPRARDEKGEVERPTVCPAYKSPRWDKPKRE